MVHLILLVVSKPDSGDYKDEQRWKGCATNLKDRASKNKDIQMLGENVVLISLQNGLDLLSEVCLKDILDLPYTYTVFDEEIEWHEASKKV
jgi:hypothetical protein